ncbi:hypothetical protein T06_9228, partial [Trichinella sp. T6]
LALRNCCFRTRSNVLLPRIVMGKYREKISQHLPPQKGEPGSMRHWMVPPGGVTLQIGLLFLVWFSPSPI